MTTYSAITDASDTVIELLRAHVDRREDVLDIDPDQIVLASPDEIDTAGPARLSVFPYQIARDPQNANTGRVHRGNNTYQDPPLVLTVNYIITAYPPSDDGNAGENLQKQQSALGLAMQVLHDNGTIDEADRKGVIQDVESFKLSLKDENDEIERVWEASVDSPLQPSVLYEAGPVIIESTKQEEISRVSDRDMGLDQRTDQ